MVGGAVSARLIRRRVLRSAAVLVGAGLLAMIAAAVLFLGVPVSGLAAATPAIALSLVAAGLPCGLVLGRLVRRALPDDGELGAGTLLRLQALPYRAAMLQVALWALAAGGLTLGWAVRTGGGAYTATMIPIGAVVLAIGVALVQVAWAKRLVAPATADLLRRDERLLERAVSRRYTIRLKLSLMLGGLVFFACGVALFTSFAQQQELVAALLADEGAARLDALLVDDRTAPALCGWLPPEDARLVVVVYGPDGVRCAAPRAGAPDAAALWGAGTGTVRLQGPELFGAATTLDDGDRAAVLLRRPARVTSSARLTLVFFTALFVFSAALVATMARDITEPIDALTRDVRGLAAGEPRGRGGALPVEPDEIGALTVAFAHMRGELEARIGTISELNRTLEEKVRARTRALEESQSQLVHAEKMASLGGLVAGVAHEINNPLNTVVNMVRPLEERIAALGQPTGSSDAGLAADEAREILAVMAEGARRTRTIVAALKTFSHGGGEAWRDTSLPDAVRSTVALLGFRLRDVELDLALDDVAALACDGSAVNQVLLNLLTNALDAVEGRPEGERRVRVAVREEDGDVVVEVEDSGPGVPPELRSRIFEPFFTTKDVGQGTGLGLSIAHGIAARHGGAIEVGGGALGGALFCLRLPRTGGNRPR